MKVVTERMIINPLSDEEMKAKIDSEKDEDMKIAYSEMLAGCKANPEQRIWSTIWSMQLNTPEQTLVGSLSFKGFNNGVVETGYGMEPAFEGQELMSEAVIAMAKWASVQPGVSSVEAEAETENIASQKVLQKAGFIPNGVMGDEGPRFIWKG